MQYEVIPQERAALFLSEQLGGLLALSYESNLFGAMRKLTTEYDGGLWELRRFTNGVFAYVFPDTSEVEACSPNACTVTCTLEAVSLAANLFVLSWLNEVAGGEKFYHLYHGLRQMIIGSMTFAYENGSDRALTPAEMEITLSAHPEADRILTLID